MALGELGRHGALLRDGRAIMAVLVLKLVEAVLELRLLLHAEGRDTHTKGVSTQSKIFRKIRGTEAGCRVV